MSKLLGTATLMVASLLLVQCGKLVEIPQTDAAPAREAAVEVPSTTATKDAGAPTEVPPPLDAGGTFDAAPPIVSCAADPKVCDGLPPSVCGNDTTLVYFSDGACIDGVCQWKQQAKACGFQSHCFQGGCTPPTTK